MTFQFTNDDTAPKLLKVIEMWHTRRWSLPTTSLSAIDATSTSPPPTSLPPTSPPPVDVVCYGAMGTRSALIAGWVLLGFAIVTIGALVYIVKTQKRAFEERLLQSNNTVSLEMKA